MITTVPVPIKKAFRVAPPPVSGEERLWRERAARMTLDALGYTNLTVKPPEHNEAVRYALAKRRPYRRSVATPPAKNPLPGSVVFQRSSRKVTKTKHAEN